MGFNSGFKGLTYTSCSQINVFNHSVTISFETRIFVPFAHNQRQRRNCYRWRNLYITAWQ